MTAMITRCAVRGRAEKGWQLPLPKTADKRCHVGTVGLCWAAMAIDFSPLDDEEGAAVAAAAKAAFDRARHPYAPDLAPLRSALVKIGLMLPAPAPGPPLPQAPRRARGGRRVRR